MGPVKRERDTESELRERITEALIRDVGVSERMAQPFVESIIGCLAGQLVYVPTQGRDYPLLHIKAALERGDSVRAVCRAFNVSRRTLYRLFPEGLPRAPEKAVVPRF